MARGVFYNLCRSRLDMRWAGRATRAATPEALVGAGTRSSRNLMRNEAGAGRRFDAIVSSAGRADNRAPRGSFAVGAFETVEILGFGRISSSGAAFFWRSGPRVLVRVY